MIEGGWWQLKDGRIVLVEAVADGIVTLRWKLSFHQDQMSADDFNAAADFRVDQDLHEMNGAGRWQPKSEA